MFICDYYDHDHDYDNDSDSIIFDYNLFVARSVRVSVL